MTFNKSEQLEFKLEKLLGYGNMQKKLEKGFSFKSDSVENRFCLELLWHSKLGLMKLKKY
jgi:hypothetical protein